jgi:hypothetical protein
MLVCNFVFKNIRNIGGMQFFGGRGRATKNRMYNKGGRDRYIKEQKRKAK